MSLSYGTSIVREGLVTHFDPYNVKSYPGTGTTVFDIAGSLNATLNGAAHSSTDKSFTFNGSSNYIQFANGTMDLNSPRGSISIWFRSYNNFSDQEIFGTSSARDRFIYIQNGSVLATAYNGTNASYLSGLSASLLLGWNSVTFTYTQDNGSNSVYELYLNGVQEAVSVQPITTDAGADNTYSRLGGNSTPHVTYYTGNAPTWFFGEIGEVLSYNRVLTGSEIQKNFLATRGRYGL